MWSVVMGEWAGASKKLQVLGNLSDIENQDSSYGFENLYFNKYFNWFVYMLELKNHPFNLLA